MLTLLLYLFVPFITALLEILASNAPEIFLGATLALITASVFELGPFKE